MYNAFFGLQKAPFNLTPDPEFLYLTAQHREALAGISYAILARKGFVVLTGDAGTGKTTLLTRVLAHLPVARVQSSVIVNPTLTPPEFLESTLLDFGFADVPASKARRIAALQNFLWKNHRERKISALVIDEAHKLSLDVLEEIRLLGNFESGAEKLLQIVLIGQCELNDLLNRKDLRQLKQRIGLRFAIEPLPESDVECYIGHRWVTAGGSGMPFTKDAVAYIVSASRGLPRIINGICDNALLEAFGEASARVEARHILAVCRDLELIESVPRSAPVEAVPMSSPPEVRATTVKYPMKTFERHSDAPTQRSLLARLLLKLRFPHRIETA
jgi:general secretion pathway protein A